MADESGPAFPVVEVYTGWNRDTEKDEVMSDISHGMTLRDWFAGQALAGILSNPNVASMSWCNVAPSDAAYQFADRMLAERKKGA